MADGAELQVRGLDRVLDMLNSLPKEVVSKRGGPVKQSLGRGARLMAKGVRQALRATLTDPDDQTTGLLVKSVIASRGKPPAAGNGERYLVRFKRQTYPGREGKPTTTLKTAQLKEYGSSHQQAEPFIRPAFRANAEKTIRLVETDLLQRVEKLTAAALKG